MIGETVSHYRIIEKIGEGGMGIVYKAEDMRLRRPVALKFLSPDLLRDEEAKTRFIQEAQSVSRIQHPNICTIHEIDECADGRLFICMDYYDGDTLKARIAGEEMPIVEACRITMNAADGLSKAHDSGLIHRDIKPANIIVSGDGDVKVMDFGIAKLAGATSVTRTDVAVGTVPYMSPEQARGDAVDARSDIFSLGTVLYELLTKVHPFRAEHDTAIVHRIINTNPTPVTAYRADIPAPVVHILEKALAKSPLDRYPSAQAFRDALAAALSPSATTPTPGSGFARATAADEIDSLAVIPFVNESGDEEADYLSDGLTDALIDNLCQLPGLRVMARSTMFRYAGADNADPLEVGARLGVRAVLTGRFTQHGNNLLIRAELVDAGNGTRLWGERYKRPLTDLLDIEDEISVEISRKLRLRLDRKEEERLVRRHTESPEAYRAYLKGRHVWARWKTPDGMRTAIGFFEKALALDPLYAPAFAGLADSYSMLGNVKAVPPGEAYPKAKTYAMQGLAIDDSLAELHTSLGFIQRFWDWDWDAAEKSFRRAIALNPGYATAFRFYGQLLGGLARFDEAIATSTRATELDPLSPIMLAALGDMYFYARRYDESVDIYLKSLELDRDFLPGHTDLARSYEMLGRYDEAIAMYEAGAALAPKGPPEPSSGLAHVYAQMGEHKKAREILEQLIEMRQTRYVSPYGLGSIHSCLKDIEGAFKWLETAYAEHDQTLVWIRVHPRLDPLRGDPRFDDLLRRMNLMD